MPKPSFPQLLSRTCLAAGALFLLSLPPIAAVATTAPEGDQPAIISGLGRVVDGDTLDVGGVRVRLEGIDAPETTQTCQTANGGTWACGKAAAAMLRKLAESQDVACDRTGTDRYRRTLATCFVDGMNIEEAMVRAGLAWAFVKYSTSYVAVEAEARKQKIGVWQGPAQAPWEFRRNGWQVAEAVAPNGCAIKGNVSANGRIYHMPWDPWYEKVKMDERRGKRWFCSQDEAAAAGWRPAASH
ncbi:thermonuclease family protein [Hyphomicrobium sp.]|uniref:thermonuclease family protein n=1 Tax=Hyphomicrobium sp. TaxID=82 RepID=UPI002D76A6CF|nr:thermonuclease family protein [Hyphomicrobium sp.]HET6389619.1 thermonuclease family protein [Hyphomicrobium sp.]